MSVQTAPTQVTTWQIDPSHSLAEFSVKHMVITTTKGRFSGLSGALQLDETDLTRSAVRVEIDAASIETHDAQRDAHLRSADFFDAERYPKLSFQSTRIEALGGDRYRVSGDLSMRGVTKEVVLEAEFQGIGKDLDGNTRVGFAATTKINRTQWGLTWNAALETGGVLVSEEVRISLEVQAVKE